MSSHDIIDNRTEKLSTQLERMLHSSEGGRFAVGYLFLSGLTGIAHRLTHLQELRLLIGSTTNRETLETIAEGCRRLDLAGKELERQTYPKRTEAEKAVSETAGNLRNAMERMDQTDEGESLIAELIRMLAEGRLKVRVYTKGRLHAKAYICDYGTVYDEHGNVLERSESGIAVVGSSNLTLSGLTHNTELNVVVHGNQNHRALGDWFEALWAEARDFDETLMHELKASWAAAPVRPYDIYMKTLHGLVKDRVEEEEDESEFLWDDDIFRSLAQFQKVAVRQAIQIIRDYGGAFVADVVGLGKSFVGAAIVKHFERANRVRPLILCPASLREMWERYNEVYELNARVLSMGYLREDGGDGTARLLADPRYRDRDFVLVDESHNLRHPNTQRYRVLQQFLGPERHCCFLTATPRNKSAWDIYHQLKLFHQDDRTDLPVDPPNLKEYFRLAENGERPLPDLLSHILLRRTRGHILRWYGFDAETHERVDPDRWEEYVVGERRAYVLVDGKHQFFPARKLETIEYSIEDTYQGLYQRLRGYLGKPKGAPRPEAEPPKGELTYARYGLWHYVHPAKQKQEPYAGLQRAGANLRGLIRVLLFKRFESSVYAFRESVRRLLRIHGSFLAALDAGFVPAGEEAQQVLYGSDTEEESTLVDALRAVSQRYDAADFGTATLRAHVEHDRKILGTILERVAPITPDQDAKLQTLRRELEGDRLAGEKRLIFTQYADTAKYLYDNLNPDGARHDIDVIYSGDKSKERIVGRFAPRANPEYQPERGEAELMTVIATDVLAEGLNMQDCDNIINYDLHWNPVRLIQRFGRIDRIGSTHDTICAYNFLPELGIEKHLKLHEKLSNRIQEIHDTIGEDARILDETESLNPDAMYAIYERDGRGQQLDIWGKPEEEYLDLSEAEEIMRQLRYDDPAEFERIAQLRDGIRTAWPSSQEGFYVFCRAGRYQQLFLLDKNGEIVSRDVARVLGAVKCAPEACGAALPQGFNQTVMTVLRKFAEEVKHREAERRHTQYLSHGQRYVLRELRTFFENTGDDKTRGFINQLEPVFRGPLTGAVKKELNRLRRNSVTGEALYKQLVDIYHQHNLGALSGQSRSRMEEESVPQIVCSEAFI